MFEKIYNYIKFISSTRFLVRRMNDWFVIKYLENKKIDVVIDVGAGKVPYKRYVNCDEYYVLDIEKRTNNENIIIADLNTLVPLKDEFADLVICTEVFEHLKKPEHAIKEISRILKKGGSLLLTTPMVWPIHEAPNDYFRYTEFGLKYLAENANLKVEELKRKGNYYYCICQMCVAPLRNRLFFPVVILFNMMGMALETISKNETMTLGYFVILRKE